MRRILTFVAAVLLALALSGCISVAGQVKLVKNQSGQWEVVEVVTTPTEGLTASGLRNLEDFFNGK